MSSTTIFFFTTYKLYKWICQLIKQHKTQKLIKKIVYYVVDNLMHTNHIYYHVNL